MVSVWKKLFIHQNERVPCSPMLSCSDTLYFASPDRLRLWALRRATRRMSITIPTNYTPVDGLDPYINTTSKELQCTLKVGLGILQITSPKRCPQVWPWFDTYVPFLNKFCWIWSSGVVINTLKLSWMKRTCDVSKEFSQIQSLQVDIKSLKYRKELFWSIIRRRNK